MNKNDNKVVFTGIEKIDEILSKSGGYKSGEFYAVVGMPSRYPVMKYPNGTVEVTLEMGDETIKNRIDAITKTSKI